MLFAERVANQRHIILMKVMVSAMLVLNVVGKTSQTLNDSVYYLLEICVLVQWFDNREKCIAKFNYLKNVMSCQKMLQLI